MRTIFPHEPWKIAWDIGIALLVVASLVITSTWIALDLAWDGWVFWFDLGVNLLFVADMVISFRTARRKATGWATAP